MSKVKQTKTSYQKPTLKKIRLDAEVLLVAGCKLTTSTSSRGCTAARCATPTRRNGS